MNNDINEKIEHAAPVPPFVKFVASAVPMVFDNSLSYYEALCALWKWLQDDVIDVINNNASVTELWRQELTTFENDLTDDFNDLSDAFDQLHEYVDTYFDNLDVQEEINNKLDQMVEDGVLQEIITTYLQSNVAWTFDTVADMKNSTNLVNGSYAQTLGFHSINDGGGAIYKITNSGTANEMDVIAVGSLFANLCHVSNINIKQFGAHGDGVTDDTDEIGAALAYAKLYNLPVFVPAGEYLVSDEYDIDFSLNLYGEGKNTSKLKQSDISKNLLIIPYVSCTIRDLMFESVENSTEALIQIKSSTGHNFSNIIKDCEFRGENKTGYGIELICTSTYGIMDCTIKDCVFRDLTNGIKFNIGSGWINGNLFSNLWFYTTVNGIEWADTASYKSCNLNTFNSIKGQASTGVNSLIYNVNGANNTFSDILLWDGGITIKIGYHARYTKIRNVTNFEIAKFIDYGWHTEVDNFYGELSRPYYLEKTLNFLNDTDGLIARTSNGNTPSISVKNNNPAVSVATVATANDFISLEGQGLTLNGNGKQMINFSFCIDNPSNVKLYLGTETTVIAQTQGNFLTFDTSVDNTATLKAIGNESTQTYGGTLSIPSLTLVANQWHKVQIWKDGTTRLDVWVDGTYIGGFDAAQRYDQKLAFIVKTLDNTVKTLSIGQVKVRTYVY